MGWKSPAYKSGQFNLKGKLFAKLGCNCCYMYNRKQMFAERVAKKEMLKAKKGLD